MESNINYLISKIKKINDIEDIEEAFNQCFEDTSELITAINEKLENGNYANGNRVGEEETEIDENDIDYPDGIQIEDKQIIIKRVTTATSSFNGEIDIEDTEKPTTESMDVEEFNYDIEITEECSFPLENLTKDQISKLLTDISERDLISFGIDINNIKMANKPNIEIN